MSRQLAAGNHTIETRNLSAGGDTVLYLIRDGAQVARNDDRLVDSARFGALSSRIDVAVPAEARYYILVRAYFNGTGGTCDVVVDGAVVVNATRFGGVVVTTGWDAGDRFQTAHYDSAGHNGTDTELYAFAPDGRFLQRNDDGGCNLCSKLQMTNSVNAGQIVITKFSQVPPVARDQVRFIINPMSRGDADGDNVSNALEAWLTSDANLPDTDGDGLSDDWEIFGLLTPYGDEDLPAYNASIIRKDLFLEIDYMARSDGGSLAPQAASVQRFVDAFASHGITLHVDQGQLGSRASRGGQVGPWRLPFDSTGCPLSQVAHDPKDNIFSYWSDAGWFAPSRRHLFVYQFMGSSHNAGGGGSTGCASNTFAAAGDLSGGAQCPANVVCMWTGILGNATKEAGTLMHETGHNLNIWHGGNNSVNRKPNHVSTMSYLFQTKGIDASGTPNYSEAALPNLNEDSLVEANGIGIAPSNHVYDIIRNKIGAVDVRSAANARAFDWNQSGAVNAAAVAADINVDGNRTVLGGFNEWARVLAGAPNGGFRWVGLNAGVVGWTSGH
ncbi:MAG: hypothetical protein HY815_30405 [Candidatus Riflebacteria bacterium]|nr:hypothetical protein [Candidatus Riflebacteria bacterium]